MAEKNDERSILGHFGQNLQTGPSLYRPHCLVLHIPLPRLAGRAADRRFDTSKVRVRLESLTYRISFSLLFMRQLPGTRFLPRIRLSAIADDFCGTIIYADFVPFSRSNPLVKCVSEGYPKCFGPAPWNS